RSIGAVRVRARGAHAARSARSTSWPAVLRIRRRAEEQQRAQSYERNDQTFHLVYSSLVRRTTEELRNVETNSKINRIQGKTGGMRIADSQVQQVERAAVKTEGKAMVARDIG